jgi:hypothetical protein
MNTEAFRIKTIDRNGTTTGALCSCYYLCACAFQKVWLHLRTAKEGKGTGERITRTAGKAVDTITLRIPKDYSGFNVTCANGRSDVGITYSPGK